MTDDPADIRLARLRPEELDEAQRRVYDAIVTGPRAAGGARPSFVDEQGRLGGPFNAMLLSPGVGDALQRLGAELRYGCALPDRVREMAILLVAHHCRCEYEFYAHAAIGRRAGLTDDDIASYRTESPAVHDDLESLVARLTLTLLTTGDLPDPLYTEAQDTLGLPTIVELIALVGYYRLVATVLTTFRVPVPD